MKHETQQTAVEWLEERLTLSLGDELKPLRGFFVLAKEMEKERIEKAYKYARAHWSREDGNAERYYNKTYGGNK